MDTLTGSIHMPHRPSDVLLAAQARADRIRRQDDALKQEIAWLTRFLQVDYEQARRYVLASKGLLK